MAERPLPAYDGDEPYIFVTYAHEDADLVYPHIRWLQAQGFNVWWDEGISPGAAWRAELADAIESCSLLLYFITPRSVVSDHCTREVNFALDEHRRPVLAVHLLETTLPGALGLSLSDRQAILQHALEPMDYERKLVSAVATYLDQPVPVAGAPRLARASRRGPFLTVMVTSIVSLVLGALAMKLWPDDSAPEVTSVSPQIRFEFQLPEGVSLPSSLDDHLAIDPDGTEIYFIGEREDRSRQIYVRPLNGFFAQPVDHTAWAPGDRTDLQFNPQTDAPTAIDVSPDGRSLLLTRGGRNLELLDLDGRSTPTELVKVDEYAGTRRVHWGADETILFRESETAIARLTDGKAETLIRDDSAELLSGPVLTPDGKGFLFYQVEGAGSRSILFKSFNSDQIRKITDGTDARITPNGNLLLVRNRTIWAAKLSPSYDAVASSPVQVMSGIETVGPGGTAARYVVSSNGTLVYQPANEESGVDLVWVTRAGEEERILRVPTYVGVHARISPDQKYIAYTIGQAGEIWNHSLSEDLQSRIADVEPFVWGPFWFPDSRRVLFSRWFTTHYVADVSRTDALEKAYDLQNNRPVLAASWIPGSTSFLFNECEAGPVNCDIGVMDFADPSDKRLILATDANERQPALSPDGRFLAYATDEFGVDRIVIRPYPAVDSAYWQVAADNCSAPKWATTGNELFVWCGDGLFAIPVTLKESPELGALKFLFSTVPYTTFTNHTGDVAGDGERFLMYKLAPQRNDTLVVVTNWLQDVERRLEP